ncbi:MAG: hypothetical protein LGR52_16240, partial [Candidatus Thiosymbion ectosymbiont of Robbea hypermnestra]|nr:hypothetical protein [Candidatus Thiosymbion ectosymbiont of Robbea hypermnestra]
MASLRSGVVGKSCVMFNVFLTLSHKDTKNFALPSLNHPRDVHRRRRGYGRFPFILVSLGGLVSLVRQAKPGQSSNLKGGC